MQCQHDDTSCVLMCVFVSLHVHPCVCRCFSCALLASARWILLINYLRRRCTERKLAHLLSCRELTRTRIDDPLQTRDGGLFSVPIVTHLQRPHSSSNLFPGWNIWFRFTDRCSQSCVSGCVGGVWAAALVDHFHSENWKRKRSDARVFALS